MPTRSFVVALLTGLAVAAALPAAADAALTVSSTDPGTILVRGDDAAGGATVSSSPSPAGGLLTISTGEGIAVAADNAAGCVLSLLQDPATTVTCDGLAGKTVDLAYGGGQTISSVFIAAADAPGTQVVYHGSDDRDLFFGQNSSVPLTVSLGGGVNQDARGGSAADTLTGGPESDNFFGNDGADHIQGGPGNDTVNASTGDDVVDGGPGDDTVNGGEGDDTLRGGEGDDTFTIAADDGADSMDGGDQVDVASYAARTAPLTLSLNGLADDGAIDEHDNLVAIETLRGGNKADTITGDAFTNYLYGNAGDDQLNGGEGFDVLRGNDGDDTVVGRDAGFVRDDVACNAGADTAVADFMDTVASDCETVDRAAAPIPPAVVPVPPVVAPVPPAPDLRAPAVKLTGVPAGGRVTRASLRKGLTLKIGTDEAAKLDVRIVRSVARAAAVAPKDNLTLARVTKPRATGTRTVKLVPAAALLGRGAKTLKLVVVATDAAGNVTTVSRTLRLR